eukprot:COSAG02_NODE_337_length_24268_cov_7.498738_3_plen_196_part_00
MQVSEFFEPIGMFHRNFPWARLSSVLSAVQCTQCCTRSSRSIIILHFRSIARERPGEQRLSDSEIIDGCNDGLLSACHDCNQWHEVHCKGEPFASVDDVKASYQKFRRLSAGANLYVPESPVKDTLFPDSPEPAKQVDKRKAPALTTTVLTTTCLKRFPSKHTYRLQSPVPNSICPGWMLRAGPRAAAHARTSGI